MPVYPRHDSRLMEAVMIASTGKDPLKGRTMLVESCS